MLQIRRRTSVGQSVGLILREPVLIFVTRRPLTVRHFKFVLDFTFIHYAIFIARYRDFLFVKTNTSCLVEVSFEDQTKIFQECITCHEKFAYVALAENVEKPPSIVEQLGSS